MASYFHTVTELPVVVVADVEKQLDVVARPFEDLQQARDTLGVRADELLQARYQRLTTRARYYSEARPDTLGALRVVLGFAGLPPMESQPHFAGQRTIEARLSRVDGIVMDVLARSLGDAHDVGLRDILDRAAGTLPRLRGWLAQVDAWGALHPYPIAVLHHPSDEQRRSWQAQDRADLGQHLIDELVRVASAPTRLQVIYRDVKDGMAALEAEGELTAAGIHGVVETATQRYIERFSPAVPPTEAMVDDWTAAATRVAVDGFTPFVIFDPRLQQGNTSSTPPAGTIPAQPTSAVAARITSQTATRSN